MAAYAERMTTRRLAAWLFGLPAVIALSSSCSDDEAGSGGSGANGNTTATTGTANAGGAGGSTGNLTTTTGTSNVGGGSGISYCGGKLYQCGDQMDNDADGLTDAADPDCLGACDNTEDSYYPNLPGMTGAECKTDCFWDNGNGSGNDDCYWDHQCDPLEIAPNFPPEQNCEYDPSATPGPGLTCAEAFNQQSDTCLDYCAPLTPNGCDCFGCCELPAGGGEFVWLGSYDDDGIGSCTIADIGDPLKCKPCTPVPGCGNPCDPCEVCIGKPEPDPGCTGEGGAGAGGGPTGSQCPDGIQECGLQGQAPCPSGFYCITGCCQADPE
jgi:hypothetical protein